jgi:FKBP-type peptidyl-prolyl cis-trans isomerase SlyD
MKIAANTVVAVEYVLLVEGEVADSTPEGEKFYFLYGEGHILPPGLEAALSGMEEGAFHLSLPPDEGAGEYDAGRVFTAKREDFPAGEDVAVGEYFYFEDDDGSPVAARVTSVDGDEVVLDANPELAGKTLEYDGVVHEVRAATEGEIEHGHVHGEGGVEH